MATSGRDAQSDNTGPPPRSRPSWETYRLRGSSPQPSYHQQFTGTAAQKSRELKVFLVPMGNTKTTMNRGDDHESTEITHLPQEMLLHIFSWLSFHEIIFTITLVCKLWYELSLHSSLHPQTLSFNGRNPGTAVTCILLRHSPNLQALLLDGREDLDLVLQQVQQTNNHLKVLSIKRCLSLPPRDYTPDLVRVIRHCPELIELTIKATPFRCALLYMDLVTLLPGLRKLNCSYNERINPADFVIIAGCFSALEDLRCLKSFGLPVCHDLDLEMLCTGVINTLKILKITAAGLTDKSISAIGACPNIHTLHLPCARNITYNGLKHLEDMKHLESLHLSLVDKVLTSSWCDFFTRMVSNNLTKLSLEYCPYVADNVLNCIGRKYHGLVKFRLRGCSGITHGGLEAVIKECPKLKYLNVTDTGTRVYKSFKFIPECLPQLETLVYRHYAVDEETEIVEHLKEQLPQLKIEN